MEEYNNFLTYFESEKVKQWEKSYINYKNIIQEISDLFKIKQIQLHKDSNGISEFEEFTINNIEEIKSMNKTFSNTMDIKSNINSKNTNSSLIKEEIKSFFHLIDKEVKKLNVFYSSKEKDIYNNISKKIENKSKISDKSCVEILKEIDELDYLNELCLQVLLFIYLNIQALKSILRILDNSLNTEDQSISYKFIKRFLSKNNSDLIYILNFKTLDETILSIQGLLDEYKKALKKFDEYKTDSHIKKEYKDFKKNIKKNILKFDEIHEKIFSELAEWKKYLDINLDLPSSNRNSIFRETPFVGDFLIKKSKTQSFTKITKEDCSQNQNSDSGIIYLKTIDLESINSLKTDISDVFKDEEEISNMTKKLVSSDNATNLRFFYILVFFYTYSYFVIIPKILYILENKLKLKDKDYKKYYGMVISLPSLGSLISQQYIIYLIKWDFKLILIRALFFVIFHYCLLILGIELKDIHLIFFARFLLGLSSLERLCKIYIDICIPEPKQAKSNKNYLTSIYTGYIFALLLSDFEIFLISCFSEKRNKYSNYEEYEKNNPCNEFELLYFISCLLLTFISILIIIAFKNPSNKNFKKINDSIANYSKENRLTTKFLDNEEKITVEKQENLFQNANKLMSLSKENELKKYTAEIERKKSNHFTKVFLLLILFLISSQYTSENNLMLIPRLFELEKKDKNYNNKENYNIRDDNYYISYLGNIIFAISYLISLLMQKLFLKKVFFKESSKKILIILFSIPIIILLLGFWPYLGKDYFAKQGRSIGSLFPILGNFSMIIISELLMIVIVNLFIGLLPIDESKFLCIKQSSFINITDKLSRLLPGIIYMILCTINNNNGIASYLFLLGVEFFFLLLSFIFCNIKGNYLLKSHSLTRIYTKN